MNMDQSYINTALALILAIAGWVLRTIWDMLRSLQAKDGELADKVNKIEGLVKEDYVKRTEFQHVVDAMFTKLDKILDKLDGKADR